jgi:hypothetical protein
MGKTFEEKPFLPPMAGISWPMTTLPALCWAWSGRNYQPYGSDRACRERVDFMSIVRSMLRICGSGATLAVCRLENPAQAHVRSSPIKPTR